MDEQYFLSRFGLEPDASDLPEIRELIQTLTAEDNRTSDEPLKTLCIQLFSAGEPQDSLLIWKAKRSSFDAFCYIDIELTCGGGFTKTIEYLNQNNDPDAKELISFLNECSDHHDFTRESIIESYRDYYRL